MNPVGVLPHPPTCAIETVADETRQAAACAAAGSVDAGGTRSAASVVGGALVDVCSCIMCRTKPFQNGRTKPFQNGDARCWAVHRCLLLARTGSPPRPSQRSHVGMTQAVWCGSSRHELHSRPPVQLLPVPVKPGLQAHTGVLPELVQVASGLQPPLLTAQAPAFGQQQDRVEAASQPHDGCVCRVRRVHHCKQRHQTTPSRQTPCSCPPHSHQPCGSTVQAGG